VEKQLVVFNLDKEHYGVDIAAVAEIIRPQPIAAMPCAPAFVEGVTNLRGSVLPVIDLRKRFGLPVQELTKPTRIVVTEMNAMLVGMVVDAVTEVLRVPSADVEPPSPIVTTVDSAFITGIAKVNGSSPESDEGRLIILLDLSVVLSSEEKADLQAFQQARDEALMDV
jgi:purine-binding chemotaxis protein CheW